MFPQDIARANDAAKWGSQLELEAFAFGVQCLGRLGFRVTRLRGLRFGFSPSWVQLKFLGLKALVQGIWGPGV